jgi:hypothetical protein
MWEWAENHPGMRVGQFKATPPDQRFRLGINARREANQTGKAALCEIAEDALDRMTR